MIFIAKQNTFDSFFGFHFVEKPKQKATKTNRNVNLFVAIIIVKSLNVESQVELNLERKLAPFNNNNN